MGPGRLRAEMQTQGREQQKKRPGQTNARKSKGKGKERQEAADREAGSPRSPVGTLEKAAPGPTGQAPPGRDAEVMPQGGCALLFL